MNLVIALTALKMMQEFMKNSPKLQRLVDREIDRVEDHFKQGTIRDKATEIACKILRNQLKTPNLQTEQIEKTLVMEDKKMKIGIFEALKMITQLIPYLLLAARLFNEHKADDGKVDLLEWIDIVKQILDKLVEDLAAKDFTPAKA